MILSIMAQILSGIARIGELGISLTVVTLFTTLHAIVCGTNEMKLCPNINKYIICGYSQLPREGIYHFYSSIINVCANFSEAILLNSCEISR
jgi:hypothetical protein